MIWMISSRPNPWWRAKSRRSRVRASTAPRWGVPATVMPRPRRNSSRPSSLRMCRARRTVFLFTPSTTARSLARGRRSPLGQGQALAGACSSTGTPLGTGTVQPAMVDAGTGAMRLAGTVRLGIGEDRAWALWLPDGRHLLTGGAVSSYAVNAATLSARPLYFIHGRDHYIEASQYINYSAVILPPRL